MITFGIRELPNPRGEGYFYYKLEASGRERFVDFVNLYNTPDEELRVLFSKALRKIHEDSFGNERFHKGVKDYRTDNMSERAESLLRQVIDDIQ